jgi:hypothetical protein
MNAWSAEQQRLLAALGVPLFVRAAAPVVRVHEETTKCAGADDFTALRAALERAAGGRNLAQLLLDLPQLRASGAAKRALWPTLRALRKGR